MTIAIIGGGIAGCCIALELAKQGKEVTIYEQHSMLITEASLYNEGKLHLGYVYAADPTSQTHIKMIRGSQRFLADISRLTDTPKEWFHTSRPFIYGIPNDSQLSVEEISDHFEQVDEALKPSTPSIRIRDLRKSALNIEQLQAAFQTNEISVNPSQIASTIAAAVMANPLINTRLKHRIETVQKTTAGGYQLECFYNEENCNPLHSTVINCSWADRKRLDTQLDIHQSRATMLRYKLAIQFNDLPFHSNIPSLTLITGTYGDIVNHGNGSYFLSWYPSCKIAETTSPDPKSLYDAASAIKRNQIINESFKALSGFAPNVNELLTFRNKAKVAGGVISGWGKSDIDDPSSELHQRHDIGFKDYFGWISVDTGKYCTATEISKNVASYISDRGL